MIFGAGFFGSRIEQLARLAPRHRVPASYQFRELEIRGLSECARQSWCDPAGARSYAGIADEVVSVRFSSTISRIGETNGSPHGEHSVRRKQ
jgi:hypothetical protein